MHNFIFDMESTYKTAKLILLPVQFDSTCSYNFGTCDAPYEILTQSYQVDIDKKLIADKIFWQEFDIIKKYNTRENIEFNSNKVYELVYDKCKKIIKNKTSGLIGGEHGVAYGHIKSLSEKYENEKICVIQFDAHMDLRKKYQDITYSHASVMRNVLDNCKNIDIIQIGVRDFGNEESELVKSEDYKHRIFTIYDKFIYECKLSCNMGDITNSLSVVESYDKVYISFDIDVFNPSLCPNTGTPVPGGIEFNDMLFIFDELKKFNVIGFDLCEVGNKNWDANVGSRVLYELCKLMIR
jgi:agmatinase